MRPVFALPTVVIAVAACGSTAVSDGTPGPKEDKASTESAGDDPMYVPPTEHDFADNPALLDRIRVSPHGYFRFVNVAFSEAVCGVFRDDLPSMPTVNLHGDAHIEQYAVTSFGRGMTDFDDSSAGPGIIDVIRFGVSARLACEERGWGDGADVLQSFLRGYRQALDEPETIPDPPRAAQRIRESFTRDRTEFLEWADGLMQPLPDEERGPIVEALERYAASLLSEDDDLPSHFFELEHLGALRMGIGSALDDKYLVRVEGATRSTDDDIVLEVKEIRDLSGISCIQNAESIDPFRILVGQSRIAYEPYPYLGYARFNEKHFWIHGWADNYQELALDTLPSHEELVEIAFDIGVQLGRGHCKQIAAPMDAQLRRRQGEVIEEHEEQIAVTVAEFTRRIRAAWERFRDAAEHVPEGGGE